MKPRGFGRCTQRHWSHARPLLIENGSYEKGALHHEKRVEEIPGGERGVGGRLGILGKDMVDEEESSESAAMSLRKRKRGKERRKARKIQVLLADHRPAELLPQALLLCLKARASLMVRIAASLLSSCSSLLLSLLSASLASSSEAEICSSRRRI